MKNLLIEEILPFLRGVSIGTGKTTASIRIFQDGSGHIVYGHSGEGTNLKHFDSIIQLEQIITGEKDAENHQTDTKEKSTEEKSIKETNPTEIVH